MFGYAEAWERSDEIRQKKYSDILFLMSESAFLSFVNGILLSCALMDRKHSPFSGAYLAILYFSRGKVSVFFHNIQLFCLFFRFSLLL